MLGFARLSCLQLRRFYSFHPRLFVRPFHSESHSVFSSSSHGKLKVGVFETGRPRPVFKQFWAPDSSCSVNLQSKARRIDFALEFRNQIQSWSLQFRIADLKFLVRSKHGPVLCFGASPQIFKVDIDEGRAQHSVDTSLGRLADPLLLPYFHHYLLELKEEEKDRLITLLTGPEWNVNELRPADEEDIHVLSSPKLYGEHIKLAQAKRKELQNTSFEIGYLVEHLITRSVLHLISLPEVFSCVDLTETPVQDIVDGLRRLQDHLVKCLDLINGMPPLHAASSHLMVCIHSRTNDFGRSNTLVRQSNSSDALATIHWAERLPLTSSPDFFSSGDDFTQRLVQPSSEADDEKMRYLLMRRVFVTPTGIKAGKEQSELSNRVLRKYWQHKDRFLRVRFCGESVIWPPKSAAMLDRIKFIFEHGMDVAGRHYKVLAFSASQVRDMIRLITFFDLKKFNK